MDLEVNKMPREPYFDGHTDSGTLRNYYSLF